MVVVEDVSRDCEQLPLSLSIVNYYYFCSLDRDTVNKCNGCNGTGVVCDACAHDVVTAINNTLVVVEVTCSSMRCRGYRFTD